MKKFLIAFLLFSVGIIPTISMAEEDICFQYTGASMKDLLDKYFAVSAEDDHYVDGSHMDAARYMLHEALKAYLTCDEVDKICNKAGWGVESEKCVAFKVDLGDVWKQGSIKLKKYAKGAEGYRQRMEDVDNVLHRYCEAANCPWKDCAPKGHYIGAQDVIKDVTVTCRGVVIGIFGPDFKPIKLYK